jgi:hypothetical protein
MLAAIHHTCTYSHSLAIIPLNIAPIADQEKTQIFVRKSKDVQTLPTKRTDLMNLIYPDLGESYCTCRECRDRAEPPPYTPPCMAVSLLIGASYSPLVDSDWSTQELLWVHGSDWSTPAKCLLVVGHLTNGYAVCRSTLPSFYTPVSTTLSIIGLHL